MMMATIRASALCLAAALAAPAYAATPAAAPAASKPDMAKGQTISTGVCAACHTNDGTRGSPANPILMGQHPEYLVKQLQEFKAGKRNNPIMKGIASTLSDDDMKNVSAFYASKTAKPGFAKDKVSVTQGQTIYRAGIVEKGVPACAGCHSPNGAGVPVQYPRLGGQHGDYTEGQLVAFRSGLRANSAQMTQIAQRLSDSEMKAVADYIAGLK